MNKKLNGEEGFKAFIVTITMIVILIILIVSAFDKTGAYCKSKGFIDSAYSSEERTDYCYKIIDDKAYKQNIDCLPKGCFTTSETTLFKQTYN